MRKEFFFLSLIIFLAVILRFWQLDKVPQGYYSDEASFAYNAYSVLKSGRDEYGQFLPLSFRAFGEYKAPAYIYSMIPFIAIFDLTPWATRAFSAILGVGSVILTFFLVRKLFRNEKLALASSFLLTISPWALQFNRMVHENNLAMFLIILGTFLFLKGLVSGRWLVLAAVIFSLTLYTYLASRAFTPLFVLLLITLYRKQLLKVKKWAFGALVFGLIFTLPLIYLLTSEAGWSRVSGTNIFQDKGYVMRINEERGEDYLSGFGSNKILHNKAVVLTLTFLKNYTRHLAPEFLFVSGDPVEIYNTPYHGVLYWWELPFLVLGFFLLVRRLTTENLLILGWLALAFVPAALTRFTPSASRTLIALPTFQILVALGFWHLYNSWKNLKRLKVATFVIFVAVVFNLYYYYFHYYYVHLPVHYARQWQTGFDKVVTSVRELQGNYNQVWVSKKAGSYIHFLFFLKYPPQKYQPQAHLGPLDEYGFGWVEGFDNYHFGNFPTFFELEKNILYVGGPEEFPVGVKPIKTIYYPDKTAAFYLVDSLSLKEALR